MLNLAKELECALNRLASKEPLFKLEMENGERCPAVEDWEL